MGVYWLLANNNRHIVILGVVQRTLHLAGSRSRMIPESQQREINRQKYFTAFALVLMIIVIVATYWMVG